MGKGKGAYPITRGGRVEGFRQRGSKKTKGKTVSPRRVAKRTPERRVFTVHDREYSWTKSQMKKELGVPPEDVNELWKSGQRVLPELPETFDALDRREERTDAFDADEFHDWAEDARKLCLKAGVSKESVASLWKTLPEGDLAKTDFAWFSIQVIPYGEGETFAIKVENLLKSVKKCRYCDNKTQRVAVCNDWDNIPVCYDPECEKQFRAENRSQFFWSTTERL